MGFFVCLCAFEIDTSVAGSVRVEVGSKLMTRLNIGNISRSSQVYSHCIVVIVIVFPHSYLRGHHSLKRAWPRIPDPRKMYCCAAGRMVARYKEGER